MRTISGFSDCAARLRIDDVLAPLLVASPFWATWIAESLVEIFGRASSRRR
jgi:hypothetical protein